MTHEEKGETGLAPCLSATKEAFAKLSASDLAACNVKFQRATVDKKYALWVPAASLVAERPQTCDAYIVRVSAVVGETPASLQMLESLKVFKAGFQLNASTLSQYISEARSCAVRA